MCMTARFYKQQIVTDSIQPRTCSDSWSVAHSRLPQAYRSDRYGRQHLHLHPGFVLREKNSVSIRRGDCAFVYDFGQFGDERHVNR